MTCKVALLLVLLLGFPILSIAQDETPTSVTSQNRAGDLPFSQTVGVGPEHVDIGSGNVEVNVPIISLPGRHMPFTYGLRYNALFWTAAVRSGPGGDYNSWNIESRPYVGLGFTPTVPLLTWALQSQSCSNVYGTDQDTETTANSYIYTDPTGAKHSFGIYQVSAYSPDGACFAGQDGMGNFQSYALDAEPIFATVPDIYSTPAIYMPDGTQVGWSSDNSILSPPITEVPPTILLGQEDANGNNETVDPGWSDTLGKVPLTETNGTNQVFYNVSDSSGTQRTYTVNLGTITVHTAFGVSGVAEMGPVSRTVVTSVVLPNQSSYSFQYENSTYGGLTSITLPTGATITYTWATLSPSGNQWMTFRYVSSKTVTVGGNSATWTFSKSCVDTYCWTINTDVGDPAGNHTLYQHYDGRVIFAKVYAGAVGATLLREYDVVYGNSGGLCCVPSRVTTTLDNALQSKIEYDYDSTENIPGNVSEIREFAYGSGAAGSLIRRTDKTYGLNSNSNYLSRNIVSKVTQETVYDSTTNTCKGLAQPCEQRQYEYDNYVAGDNPLLSTSNVAQHDYTNFSSSLVYRGNVTRVKHWRNTDGALLTTTYQYDDLGNIRAIKDPLGHPTSFDYSDSFANSSCLPPANSQAYISTVTNALGQQVKVVRYPCTGLVQAHKDQNDINASRAGTTYGYDLLGRLTQKNFPDGGQASNAYTDVAPVSVTTTTKISSSLNLTSTAIEDSLARITQSQLTSDPDGTDYKATTYDSMGRPYQVYNPTRCYPPTTNCGESTWGVATSYFDALGRTCLVVPPDGTLPTGGSCPSAQPSNDVLTTFLGNTVTVSDEAGKSRKSVFDALGRLTQVFEDPAGLNYETDYSYDALDNLITVNQKGGSTNSANWRTRTFVYDSLSRLTSATNPESGTVTYSYDAEGNLVSKTSPAPNQIGSATVTLSYCYDALNRLTSKAYSAQSCPMSSPIASYSYDQTSYNGLTITNGVGRRTGMSDQAGLEAWSYDSMGRPLTDQRTTSGITKTVPYSYNLDGSLASLTYRQDHYPETLSYTPGGAGRPISAPFSDGWALAYAVHYAPNGSLCSLYSGWGQTFEHNYTFNNRFQVIDIQDWDQTWYAYDYGSSPPPCIAIADSHEEEFHLTYSYTDASGHNNGDVQRINNDLDMERTQLFSYDSLNRLATAETLHQNQPWWQGDSPTAACWGEQFNYDPWGNLTGISPVSSAYTGCTQENWSMTATTKNQLQDTNSDYVYDAAGNLIQPGPIGGPYVFDAENHLISAGGMAYLYDGDGKRVGKAPVNTPTQPNYLYWYGMGPDILEETDGAGNYLYRDFRFNGMLLARGEDDWVDHFFSDALGNIRCVYGDGDPDGGCSDYYPFGGERPITSGGVNVSFKFTGKERDAESNLDEFGARYYSSALGRFTIPDWAASPQSVPYANFGDPQSLNLYSYVQNNPLKSTDPTGHCEVDGEKHWGWCLWHSLGLYETKKETAAREKNEAEVMEFLRKHPEILRQYQFALVNVATVGALTLGEAGGAGGNSTVTSEGNAGTSVEAGWVRVGRWMSRAELAEMEGSGAAVESTGGGGGSRVALPASAGSYKAAPAGDVYVEYDIPAGAAKPSGSGWAKIPGPNSTEGRLAAQQGQPTPAMPPVRNIKVVKTD